jgi:hypothetical protein
MRPRRRRQLNIYTKSITAYVTIAQKQELVKICRERNLSMSELIRSGLRPYLKDIL